MPKKTCKYCGIVPMNHKCPVVARNKNHYRNSREDANIYHTKEWKELRAEVLEECNNICLWSMYIDGVIRVADRVHHIVEVLEDKSLAYDKDNAIGLNEESHRQVHELYKTEHKEDVQELLRQLKRDYDKGIRIKGFRKYKKLVDEWENSPPTF